MEEFKGWTSKGAVFLVQAEVEKRLGVQAAGQQLTTPLILL